MEAPAAAPAPGGARAAAFAAALAAPVAELAALAALAAGGVPEAHRAAVWRLLLNAAPPERAARPAAAARRAAEYAAFCAEFSADADAAPPAPPPPGDHPLSAAPDSRWRAAAADAELRAQIARDAARTHPGLAFFAGAGPASPRRRAALARALYVTARLNKGVGYVQGMNELLAPLLYVFATEPAEPAGPAGASGNAGTDLDRDAAAAEAHAAASAAAAEAEAEADAFFALLDLLGTFRDLFLPSLDAAAEGGVLAALAAHGATLRRHDARLAAHLERLQVAPQFYCLRWSTTLLAQDFPLPDVLRLWDFLIGDGAAAPGGRADALRRLCAAAVLGARRELLAADFAGAVKLLQALPAADADALAARAAALRAAEEAVGA